MIAVEINKSKMLLSVHISLIVNKLLKYDTVEINKS